MRLLLLASLVFAAAPLAKLTKDEMNAAIEKVKASKVEDLKASLKSPSRKTRLATAYGVASVGRRELATAMAALFDDPEPLIRGEAAWYFVEHQISGYNGAFHPLLKDPSEWVRKEAVIYLARFGTDGEKAAAKALADDPDKTVREAVAKHFPRTPLPDKSTCDALADVEDFFGKPALKRGLVRRAADGYHLDAAGKRVELWIGDDSPITRLVDKRLEVSGCLDGDTLWIYKHTEL